MLHNLKPNRLYKKRSAHADAKPGYDNARYYAIQITTSQFIDKPRDASTSVARSCNC